AKVGEKGERHIITIGDRHDAANAHFLAVEAAPDQSLDVIRRATGRQCLDVNRDYQPPLRASRERAGRGAHLAGECGKAGSDEKLPPGRSEYSGGRLVLVRLEFLEGTAETAREGYRRATPLEYAPRERIS